MASFFTVEKEINGTKYIAQYNGLRAMMKMLDSSYIEGTENTSIEKTTDYILKNVIVEPKGLTIEDFDAKPEELNELIAFGREVMAGEGRPKDKEPTKAKGTK